MTAGLSTAASAAGPPEQDRQFVEAAARLIGRGLARQFGAERAGDVQMVAQRRQMVGGEGAELLVLALFRLADEQVDQFLMGFHLGIEPGVLEGIAGQIVETPGRRRRGGIRDDGNPGVGCQDRQFLGDRPVILDDSFGEDPDPLVAGLGQRLLGGFDPRGFRPRRRLDEQAVLLRRPGCRSCCRQSRRQCQDEEEAGEPIFHDAFLMERFSWNGAARLDLEQSL